MLINLHIYYDKQHGAKATKFYSRDSFTEKL